MAHCENIRNSSVDVFQFLTAVFENNLNFSELGITDYLIFRITKYSNITNDNSIEIYKLPWNYESKYGNVIDLFVQDQNGLFNWYILQAKVMSKMAVLKR